MSSSVRQRGTGSTADQPPTPPRSGSPDRRASRPGDAGAVSRSTDASGGAAEEPAKPVPAPPATSTAHVPRRRSIDDLMQTSAFWRWADRVFLRRVRARVETDPVRLLEDLIQARVYLLLMYIIAGVMLTYWFAIFADIDQTFLRNWVMAWFFICSVVLPYTLSRSSSARLHCNITAFVFNVAAWTNLFRGPSYRVEIQKLIFTPVCTMFMLGSSPGLLSVISCFGAIVARYVNEKNGWVPPVVYAPEIDEKLPLITGWFSLLLVWTFAYSFEMIRGMRMRMLEVLNSELNAAVIEAEQANEMKTRFLANMSHEIRTPLNGIIGMTEILLQSQLSITQRKELNIISQCGTGLLAIITDILDFSKVVANKVELEMTPFSMDHLIARCFDTLALRAYEKRIHLIHDLSGLTVTKCVGDPTRIQQITLNLLSNAVKFTPEEGEVSLRMWSEPGNLAGRPDALHVRCEVSDSGVGVPADRVALVFEAFNQGDVSTTRTHGGTGLGLAITRALVQLMGGQIAVRSRSNGASGAVFAFDFFTNVAPGTKQPAVKASPRASPRGAGHAGGMLMHAERGKAVMLWDDVESSEAATQAMLTAFAHIISRWQPSMRDICTQMDAFVVNMATYQSDSDEEKERLVIALIGDEITERRRRKPYRFVFLNNPLGTRTPLLDVYLASAGVAQRVRVVHVDAGTYGTTHPESLGYGLHRRHSASGSVSDDHHRSLSRQFSSVSSAHSTSSSDSGRHLDPAAVVAEIVCLTKPALPRHLHWAVTCPLNSLGDMEPGLGVLDVTGAEFQAANVSLKGGAALSPAGMSATAEGSVELPGIDADGGLESSTDFTTQGDHSTGSVVHSPPDGAGVDSPGVPSSSHAGVTAGGASAGRSGAGLAKTLAVPPLVMGGVNHMPASSLLEGSTASVGHDDATSPTGAAAASAAAAAPEFRVVIVEDNKVNINVAVKLLRLLSHTVVDVCENGAIAVQYMQEHLTATPPGTSEPRLIILMDLHMPVKGGQEAADEIKAMCADQGRPAPYIVAVTADALESTRAACLASSFDDFLSKPFNLARLKQVLQRGRELA